MIAGGLELATLTLGPVAATTVDVLASNYQEARSHPLTAKFDGKGNLLVRLDMGKALANKRNEKMPFFRASVGILLLTAGIKNMAEGDFYTGYFMFSIGFAELISTGLKARQNLIERQLKNKVWDQYYADMSSDENDNSQEKQ